MKKHLFCIVYTCILLLATVLSLLATFVFSVNYETQATDGTITEVTKKFPYETDSDKLKATPGVEISKETVTSDERTTILDFAGCYEGKNVKDYYMTEWSFPGSYINNKTGQASYKTPDAPEGWKYES